MAVVSVLSDSSNFPGKNRVPIFLIIGTQKAGSTALHSYLSRHPSIRPATTKEIHFFSSDSLYSKGLDYYHSKFPLTNDGSLFIDASPSYLANNVAYKRIYEYNPEIKMIALLRDPVDRAYSAWNMYRRFNESGASSIFKQFTQHANPPEREAIRNLLFAEHYPSFKQAVMDDIEREVSQSNEIEPSFVRRGVYCQQIANYLQYFSLSSFFFLEQRELNYPASLLRKISIFLSLEMDLSLVHTTISLNIGDYPSFDSETKEMMLLLREFYRPHNEKLFSQIGIKYDWNEEVGF